MEKEFIRMIDKHRGIIYKVCNLYRNKEEDKRDLFQEIVLQLWKSYPSFRGDSKQSTWMYRVALNVAITIFRNDSKKPSKQAISLAELEIPDMTGLAGESDNLIKLKQVIEQLTKIERAITMLYLDEKSYDEIGDIIGISNSNVGVKLNRIKTKIKRIINTR